MISVRIPDTDLETKKEFLFVNGSDGATEVWKFTAADLRALVRERAKMCGWRPSPDPDYEPERYHPNAVRDGWWIPVHILDWFAEAKRTAGIVVTREQFHNSMNANARDWWDEYDSPTR